MVRQYVVTDLGVDPARGPFRVEPKRHPRGWVARPGKTREDRMPVGERPRVAAAQARRSKPSAD